MLNSNRMSTETESTAVKLNDTVEIIDIAYTYAYHFWIIDVERIHVVSIELLNGTNANELFTTFYGTHAWVMLSCVMCMRLESRYRYSRYRHRITDHAICNSVGTPTRAKGQTKKAPTIPVCRWVPIQSNPNWYKRGPTRIRVRIRFGSSHPN